MQLCRTQIHGPGDELLVGVQVNGDCSDTLIGFVPGHVPRGKHYSVKYCTTHELTLNPWHSSILIPVIHYIDISSTNDQNVTCTGTWECPSPTLVKHLQPTFAESIQISDQRLNLDIPSSSSLGIFPLGFRPHPGETTLPYPFSSWTTTLAFPRE